MLIVLMLNKGFNMASIMDKLITVTLVIGAAITLWAVVTPNHLYIG